MRFDKRVTFVTNGEEYYDPDRSEWVRGEPTLNVVPCNVSRMGVERTNQIFGSLDKVVTVIRLQRTYDKPFDRIYLGSHDLGSIENENALEVIRQSDYRKGVLYVEGLK